MKIDWNRVRHITTGVLAVVSGAGILAGYLPPGIGVPLLAASAFATTVERVLRGAPAEPPKP